MKTKKIIITAAISYFLFLLALIPAETILPLLNKPANGITLQGISGSLWSGSIDEVDLKKQSIQSLKWSLNPFSLFTASLSSDLEASFHGQTLSTQLDYALISKAITFNDLKSTIDAKELTDVLKLPFGKLHGIVNIDLNKIRHTAGELPLVHGRVVWNNAKLTLSETSSFGRILLNLDSDDAGGLIGKLSNKQGELSIQGDIKVLANQSYTLNIKLTPRANASSELKSMLSLIAPKKVKSDHIINRRGQLKDLGIRL